MQFVSQLLRRESTAVVFGFGTNQRAAIVEALPGRPVPLRFMSDELSLAKQGRLGALIVRPEKKVRHVFAISTTRMVEQVIVLIKWLECQLCWDSSCLSWAEEMTWLFLFGSEEAALIQSNLPFKKNHSGSIIISAYIPLRCWSWWSKITSLQMTCEVAGDIVQEDWADSG